ncbi:MAG: hypothetical protein U7126_17035 [Microcoleus sp.]
MDFSPQISQINADICWESAIFWFWLRSPKKNPTKIGRELINQGASTNLVSGISTPLSGQFGFFTADDAD